jgi:hypothetical protein
MATPEPMEFDAQDQAEVFDEETRFDDDERVDQDDEPRTFEEAPDVYDATTALGDGREVRAMDADEFDEDDLDDDDLEEDEDLDDSIRDDLEDASEDEDAGSDDLDDRDGVTRLAGDESDLEYVADVDTVTDPDDDDADKYESRQVSDEDLRNLGYQSMQGEPRTEEDDKSSKGSGASADDVPDEAHPRQDELLDEGIEETFPASDPVSVKRIT